MNIDSILETFIGLFFVYFLLSMACMQIQEWFESLLKNRARNLENAIRAMLEGEEDLPALYTPKTLLVLLVKPSQLWNRLTLLLKRSNRSQAPKDSFTGRLYSHALIQSLQKDHKKPPSYISSTNFALALFDIVMAAGTDASQIRRALAILNEQKDRLPALAGEAAQKALDDLITQAEQAQNADEQDRDPKLIQLHEALEQFLKTYERARPTLEALLNTTIPANGKIALEQLARGSAIMAARYPGISQTLNSIIVPIEANAEKGETALALARMNAEAWFNNTMERATGWYKRNTQWWLFAIATILVVVVNIDTVAIASTFWRDPTLRQMVVAQAERNTVQPTSQPTSPPTPDEVARQLREELDIKLKLPVGWDIEPQKDQKTWLSSCIVPKEKVRVFGIGFSQNCFVLANVDDGWPGIIAKLAGWAFSIVAAMQGAPFWFDTLGKFINLRSAGKKPATDNA